MAKIVKPVLVDGQTLESKFTEALCGVEAAVTGGFLQRPVADTDAAFDLFGYLPADDDLRWSFISRYAEVRESMPIKRIHFENAWGATYLSPVASYRSGYVTTINPENRLQLDRALDNLSFRPEIRERFEYALPGDDVDVRLRLTDALCTHAADGGGKPETPCPEALYQLRLYDDVGYLGRVGFNMHVELEAPVVSIVNIQGVPGGTERIGEFTDDHGLPPANYLVQRVQAMFDTDDESVAVRGLVNPKRGNSRLYYGTLQAEGVDLFQALHKPSFEQRLPTSTMDELTRSL